jgi:hypothetical protein
MAINEAKNLCELYRSAFGPEHALEEMAKDALTEIERITRQASAGFSRGGIKVAPLKGGGLLLDSVEPLDIDKTSSPHG